MKMLILFLASSLLMLNALPAQALDDNLKFSGTLVSEPCELDPQTSDLTVNFQSVIEKDLYLNTRTKSIPLVINLTGCDSSLGNLVTLTFKGTESTALPGLLTVTGTAAGIAIGMENQDGTPLPLNQPSPQLAIADGTNSYIFKAYVMGEPAAIQSQTITPGDFTATATFEIAYP